MSRWRLLAPRGGHLSPHHHLGGVVWTPPRRPPSCGGGSRPPLTSTIMWAGGRPWAQMTPPPGAWVRAISTHLLWLERERRISNVVTSAGKRSCPDPHSVICYRYLLSLFQSYTGHGTRRTARALHRARPTRITNRSYHVITRGISSHRSGHSLQQQRRQRRKDGVWLAKVGAIKNVPLLHVR